MTIFIPLALALTSGACRGDAAHVVTDWQLSVPTEPAARPVELPARFDDTLSGDTIEYVLRAQVEVPASSRGQSLTLSIPFFTGVIRLVADGVLLVDRHIASPDAYRAVGPHAWAIPADLTLDGALHLELQIEHRWSFSAWMPTAPRLGADPRGDPQTRLNALFLTWGHGAALGACSTIAFTCLVLFLLDRSRRAYGWLALQMFTVSYYPLWHLGVPAVLPPEIDVVLVPVAIVTAITAGLYAMYARWDLGPGAGWWPATIPLAAIPVAVFDLLTQAFVIGKFAAGLIAVYLVYVTAVTYGLWRRRQHIGAGTHLVAMVLLTLFGSVDMLFWAGLAEPLGGIHTSALGLVAYALCQFVMLSQQHLRTLEAAEAHHAEIESLNDELRHQIAVRSQQLSEALLMLGTSSPGQKQLKTGDELDGRYRIGEELGAGAMGTVFRAERIRDGTSLAIKVLRNASDTRQLARFAREAQLAAQVKHRNVVSILDIGVSATGLMYIVMEYVEGSSLHEHAGRYGDQRWAVAVLAAVARGLAALHRAGIVHRDLKPANVLVDESLGRPARVCITDFGIAGLDEPSDATGEAAAMARPPPGSRTDEDEATADTGIAALAASPGATRTVAMPTPRGKRGGSTGRSAPLTQTGALLGTPAYMAPELALGMSTPRPESDIFGFGVLAFELLSGKRPFHEPPIIAVLRRQARPVAATLDTDLPAELATLLARCLAFEPRDRPSAAELDTALSALLRAEGRDDAVQLGAST